MNATAAMRWIRGGWLYAVEIFTLGVLLAACSSNVINGNDTSTAAADTSLGSAPRASDRGNDQSTGLSGTRRGEVSGTEGAGTAASNDNTVNVIMTETGIEMPATIPAGMLRLKVKNGGTAEHNFVIQGNGDMHTFDANLKPGEARVLQFTLTPGSYDVYDPVGKNKDNGLSTKVKAGRSRQ